MRTECISEQYEFEGLGRRRVVAAFDGGRVTSHAGALLLGQLDRWLGLIRRFAACFEDRRDANLVEHSVETLLGQRVFAIALGYEDLNDQLKNRKPAIAVQV